MWFLASAWEKEKAHSWCAQVQWSCLSSPKSKMENTVPTEWCCHRGSAEANNSCRQILETPVSRQVMDAPAMRIYSNGQREPSQCLPENVNCTCTVSHESDHTIHSLVVLAFTQFQIVFVLIHCLIYICGETLVEDRKQNNTHVEIHIYKERKKDNSIKFLKIFFNKYTNCI
jgi:hypothetical protein